MKKFLLVLTASLAFASSAFAGLSEVFVSSDNKVFSLENVREVRFTPGFVTLIFTSGDQSYTYLQDNGGAVATKMKASAAFTQYVRHAGTDNYFNPKYAKYTVCDSYGTTFGWANAGAQSLNDGCATFNTIKNLAN